MGCGGSTNSDKGQNDDGHKKATMFQRQPKVSIKVGNEVRMTEKNDKYPRVIFVFGGPGTKKGRILDNMANVFGMEVINVENLIIQNLARKVENPEPERIVPMVQSLLKKEDHLLRLDSVLRMVARAVNEVDPARICLVDLVPNFKWMLNNSHFIKECEQDFKVFEEKYPISFVLYFMVDKEKIINKLQVDSAKHPTTQGGGGAGGGGSGGKKPDAPKQSDEADSSRTQKRLVLYQNSIKHFIDFFIKRDNIVTVDVSVAQQEAVWVKVCDFFSQFDFQSTRIVESVIIFGFDQKDLDEIEIQQYSLTVIKLNDIVQDPNTSVELLLDELCRYIDNSDPTRRVFAVDGTDTTLTKDLKKLKSVKSIQFHEAGDECRLGRYCNVALTNKGDPVSLQAVASIQNEVCLFPNSVCPDLCRWIAVTMAECRKKQRKS